MPGLTPEEIVVALDSFAAVTFSRWWGHPEAEELFDVVEPGSELDQRMLDLGALLLRLGIETFGLPGFDAPAPQLRGLTLVAPGARRESDLPPARSHGLRKLSPAERLLIVAAYDVMVLAGWDPSAQQPLPAAPRAFADAPQLWREAHAIACARV